MQGVGYRASCARRAEALGVSGFVRNTADGSVEAAFEGEEGAVAAMIDWCRKGPAWAAVRHVEVADEQPQGARGFVVS